MYAHACVRMCTCAHVYVCMCTCVRACTCVRVCMFVCTSAASSRTDVETASRLSIRPRQSRWSRAIGILFSRAIGILFSRAIGIRAATLHPLVCCICRAIHTPLVCGAKKHDCFFAIPRLSAKGHSPAALGRHTVYSPFRPSKSSTTDRPYTLLPRRASTTRVRWP